MGTAGVQSGSLLYMAPECYLALPYNEKADIFSLGILIFELLSGQTLASTVLRERSWPEAKEYVKTVACGQRFSTSRMRPCMADLVDACLQQARIRTRRSRSQTLPPPLLRCATAGLHDRA